MMEGFIVLAVFIGSWFGFNRWAKQAKKSKTTAVGGGFIVGCIAALLAGAIVSPGGYPDDPLPSRTKVITSTEYGDSWPLKVPQAVLGCDPPHILYLVVDGVTYALNGKALGSGLPRGDEVAKNGNAVEMSVFIQPAMALCRTQP